MKIKAMLKAHNLLYAIEVALLLGFMDMPSSIYADRFPEEIIVIGDSISDAGNSRPSAFLHNFTLFARYVPATNGNPWPVFLANKLGAKPLDPSSSGGTDFAYIGAMTNGTFVLFPNPSLTQQEQSLPRKLNKNFPVFLLGGANDIFFESAASNPGATAAVNMSNILDDLHRKHYKTLVILNLPDIGKIPSAGFFAAEYTTNVILFNNTLLEELKRKRYPVIEIDIYSAFNKLLADPEAYGLVNATSAPNPTALVGQPPAGFVFFYDGVHPSEASHKLIADYVFSILSAAQCYATLADVPFSVLREQRTQIHQQLGPLQPLHEKYSFYPFVSGSYSPQLLPPRADSCKGHDISGGNISAGFTDRVSDSWTLGAAGSYASASSSCHEQGNKCRFHLETGILSLFTGFNKNRGYANAIFNVAWLSYDDIKRTFHIGPNISHVHGDTSGINYDAEIYGTCFIWSYDSFKTGPLLEMNFQRVFVEGYRESGSDLGTIHYHKQNNKLFSTGLGWEAWTSYTYKGVGFVTDLFFAANRQWLGKTRRIHFNQISLPGTNGAWPVRHPRNTFASGGINFSASFKYGLIAALGYTFNVGTFSMSEHVLTASLTVPLGKKKHEPLSNPNLAKRQNKPSG